MPKKTTRRRNDYEVGKGRPPQHSRWQPGQSGNPRGRPKGARSLAALLANALKKYLYMKVAGDAQLASARQS